ncbi:LysR family transcriptional regulator [Clostridium aminobutyricum]|uniref:LysR family transcriptional regulator n=1 Tax=Clostridium aminobutyricum TaxID=33953 RepID=A0A939D6Q1_CLOAM|nr:LysR family transcriptional regulator [Clostridium aminobutyricum]MBN7772086.1 LysR family transcriptional regulator [Clostridium aminobutyricum]
MLDFRTETFITVCEMMNFTKAAEKLNITQPAVSQHIRFLEESYQVKLFEFSGRKMKLTESGKMLLNAFITMKHDEKILKDRLSDSLHEKKIRFGATLTVGEFILPKQITRYLKSHQSVQLKMLIANTGELLTELEAGNIDFAIVEGYFAKSEYDHRLYSKEKYIAVCAASHSFQNKSLELKDLFEETLIVREEGSGTREILEREMERQNYTLRDFKNRIEISNLNTIKYLTAENCGITFLYEAAAEKELEEGRLKKIDLEGLDMMHDITCIWRKNSYFSPYYEELLHFLRQERAVN